MRGDHHGAWQGGEPVGGHVVERGLAERRVADTGHDELVAGELRVPFELQAERSEVGAQVTEGPGGQVDAELARKVAHVLPFAFATRCVGGQRQERQPQGRLQCLGGPRMHFRVQFQPQRMIGRQRQLRGSSRSRSLRGARTNPSDA